MTEWFHCNKCCIRPAAGTKYVLTNCGHIICIKCMKTTSGTLCPLCAVKCILVTLVPPLPPQVDIYFKDPAQLFKQLSRVYKFQDTNNMKLYNAHLARAQPCLVQLHKKRHTLRKAKEHFEEAIRELTNAPSPATGQVRRMPTPRVMTQAAGRSPYTYSYYGRFNHFIRKQLL